MSFKTISSIKYGLGNNSNSFLELLLILFVKMLAQRFSSFFKCEQFQITQAVMCDMFGRIVFRAGFWMYSIWLLTRVIRRRQIHLSKALVKPFKQLYLRETLIYVLIVWQ